MVKLLPQRTAPQTTPVEPTVEPTSETETFDEFVEDELWDVDTDLAVHSDDRESVCIHFGYISALREVAKRFYGYEDSTLDSLTPNYVGLAYTEEKPKT